MTEPRQTDELTQRYLEASAQDTRRPASRVREAVRAHARMVIASTMNNAARPLETKSHAANQSRWKISLLASIALAGITGLLVLQFDRGAPEEKELVFGRPDVQTAPPLPESPAAKSQPDAKETPPAAPAKAAPKATAATSQTPATPATPPPPLADSSLAKAAAPEPAPAQAPARRADAAPAGESSGAVAPAAAAPTLQAAPTAAARAPPPQKNEAKLAPQAPQARAKAAAPHDLEQALQEAARTGNTAQLERLLQQGALVNAPDEAGRTPLMLAVMNGQTDMVRRLLALGASPAVTDREGLNALQHARRLGLDRMAALLEGGS